MTAEHTDPYEGYEHWKPSPGDQRLMDQWTIEYTAQATAADPDAAEVDEAEPRPRVVLTPASAIRVERVRWMWAERIPYGTVALIAGREGLGKSTLVYQLAADITRGILDGEDKGNPRAVIICAREDSWGHTIAPRLIAAGADLDRVFRMEINTGGDIPRGLSLPKDFLEVEWAAQQTGAGLLILDPIMSAIDAKLDSHKDQELRQALEPLKDLAERSRMAVVGLIHHNKSGSTDPLQLIMGGKAFAAVARSVHTCIPDPDDETQARRIFGTTKNNLGRLDLPLLGFTIVGHAVDTHDDDTAWTGRLNWTGPVDGSIHELMNRSTETSNDRSATGEAVAWLEAHLANKGGTDDRASIIKAGKAAGHADRTIDRAATRLNLDRSSSGFPARSYWSLPGTQPTTEPARQAVVDASSANPVGATAPASPTLPGLSHPGSSHAKSRQPLANLGATGPDQHKHHQPRAGAPTHARGDTPVGATEEPAQQHTPPAPVPPVPPTPPTRTRATPDTPPICNDCGWPLDHPNHTQCEEIA